MNEGWLNGGAGYVIVRTGLDEQLGIAVVGTESHTTVRVVPDGPEEPYTISVPTGDLRPATPLEIYEHGEARLKQQPVGPTYGADEHKTMWELMTERDREYWQSLRPEEEQ